MFSSIVNGIGGLLGGIFGETNEKVEWAMGFITKYGNIIAVGILLWFLAKVFQIRIKV